MMTHTDHMWSCVVPSHRPLFDYKSVGASWERNWSKSILYICHTYDQGPLYDLISVTWNEPSGWTPLACIALIVKGLDYGYSWCEAIDRSWFCTIFHSGNIHTISFRQSWCCLGQVDVSLHVYWNCFYLCFNRSITRMTNMYPLQHRIYQANHRQLCFEFRRPVIFEVWMYPTVILKCSKFYSKHTLSWNEISNLQNH